MLTAADNARPCAWSWCPDACYALQTFSLPLAAAMGCCSFEAYNAPYILHGVKEVSPCKTETVYMDRDFMDNLVAGVMEVHPQLT